MTNLLKTDRVSSNQAISRNKIRWHQKKNSNYQPTCVQRCFGKKQEKQPTLTYLFIPKSNPELAKQDHNLHDSNAPPATTDNADRAIDWSIVLN